MKIGKRICIRFSFLLLYYITKHLHFCFFFVNNQRQILLSVCVSDTFAEKNNHEFKEKISIV